MAVQERELQIPSTQLEWKINKFYEVPMLEEVNSSEFYFGNNQAICFSMFKNRTDARFYIISMSPITRSVLIDCLTSFVDRHGKERLTERKFVTFKQIGEGESIKRLDFQKLFKYYLLVKDALIVRCTVTVVNDDYERTMEKETLLPGLSSDFTALLDYKIFSDVVLKVGEESILAHKLILAARSRVFAAMFEHDMEENRSGCVLINDTEPLIIKILLSFVYSGVVPDICTEDIYGLYIAADKYEVLGLKDVCVLQILQNLSEDNVISYLVVADRHADEVLKQGVIAYFRDHGDIFSSDQWQEFCRYDFVLAVETFNNVFDFKLTKVSDALYPNL